MARRVRVEIIGLVYRVGTAVQAMQAIKMYSW